MNISWRQTDPQRPFCQAIQCTFPRYNTQVKPGENAVLTWQASSQDLNTYDSLTATLYCMDINGPRGGIWRTAATLFQNKGLLSTQEQFRFAVPYCGQLARDVAIRIVARGNGLATTGMTNDACYFTMNAAAVVDPPVVVPTSDPPKPAITTDPVPPPSPPPVKPGTTDPKQPTASVPGPGTTPPAVGTSPGTNPTASGSGTMTVADPYPSGRPYPPLPPLPPIPDDDSDVFGIPGPGGDSSDGSPHGPKKNIVTILGTLCGGAALVAVVSLLVMRRRQSRQRRQGRGFMSSIHGLHGDSGRGGGLKKKLRQIQVGGSFKGLNGKNGSHNDGQFFLMKDEDDEDEEYEDKSMTGQESNLAERLPAFDHDVTNTDQSQSGGQSIDRSSMVSYPESALVCPSWATRRRSNSLSLPYTDQEYDDYTMSSMRSTSTWETSSVVRKYWVASMAARTERRLEGFPRSRDCLGGGSVFGDRRTPSFSSLSRKADIFSFDDSSFTTGSLTDGASSGSARRDGTVMRHYRNTLHSMNEYLRRSMSMSLSSLRSTVPSSDDESFNLHSTGRHGRGFRVSINGAFLDHLHIKSLQDEQRQLDYYTHHYRQNPSMSTVTTAACRTGTSGLSRGSSVPSLTSTNDPFQTFDSNEILVDLGPFSDEHALPPPAAELSPSIYDTNPCEPPGAVLADDRSNSALLRSFPIPPIVACSRSTSTSSASSSSPSSNLPVPAM
ncbi:hypothetical protein BGZ70_002340 [Mortierella alpina]|uniref:Uncharacterized protein n=1 Tax=Mortierella alpina TaxID=64518 RepID=A0A9P6IUM8_MORAP|nr:hypothetical protein BGZ70_002340 [Mortierella alpina]